MILGVGTDIVEVARIAALVERYGDRFLLRVFRPDEISVARKRGAAGPAALAARWAAREAFLKALGRDPRGIPYRDVEVRGGGSRPPRLRLHGRAAAVCDQVGASRIHVALSHERGFAVATVVLEA